MIVSKFTHLSILLLISTIGVYSQSSRENTFAIALRGGANFTGLILKEKNKEFTTSSIRENITPRIGFTFGIDGKVMISEKISAGLGVYLFQEKFDHLFSGLRFESDYDPVSGTFVTESHLNIALNLHRLDVPLTFYYFLFSNPKNKILVAPGFSVSKLLNIQEDNKLTLGNGNEEELENVSYPFRDYNYSAMLGLEFLRSIDSRTNISLRSFFRINLRPEELYLRRNDSHEYSFGVLAGIVYFL
jgi:hypothetical protein